jgi:hypothetical protein
MQNNKRTFGMVVLFGFETKNFLQSGLYDTLKRLGGVAVLRRDFPTKNFDEYIEKYDLDVTLLQKSRIQKRRLKCESLLLASRRAMKRLRNIENFNYFKEDRDKKISDYFIGNRFVYTILNAITKNKIASNYFDEEIKKLYEKKGITDLVLSGYSSVESITLAVTARRIGINVYLIVNSWKDFYVNDVIAFEPTKVFVWSQEMKKQLLASNDHIDERNVIVSGSPAFDRFFRYRPVRSKAYYAEKYGFDVERPVILYSMLSPKAYEDEKASIELINRKLIERYTNVKQRPIIILRRNPIDETQADESYFSGNNVRYADNFFEGSYEHAVFVQGIEGEIEWTDLLYYADININVASTVTLEALMLGTPVINIEFDGSGKRNERLSRYADAPFYKPLRGRRDVVIAENIETCTDAIEAFLSEGVTIEPLSRILEYHDGNATKRIFEAISSE